MTEAAFFYIFTAMMVLAALLVVLSRQPVYSVLSLLAVMFCLACLFVMLGAYFLAALQILLYAGAVLVLFLFVIMLLNLAPETLKRMRIFTARGAGTVAALGFLGIFITLYTRSNHASSFPLPTLESGQVESIGRELFTAYLLPFELVSFIILAAIIGAVTLAKQELKK